MADEHPVTLTSGSPDTVLPALAPDIAEALASAGRQPAERRKAAVAEVAARWPDCLQAWAALAAIAHDPVEQYAYARTGYHRGLDALRASGWRGSGLVRWRYPENRGFLRSLRALGLAAGAIGETAEEQRCATFFRQLDPGWTEPPVDDGQPG